MKAYKALAQALKDQGIGTLFGLMGDGNMQYIASFIDDFGGHFVGSPHEGGAMSMADGFARVTGKVGVVSITHGPGTTNTLTSLVEAVRARTPLVVLTAATARSRRHHGQWFDLRGLVAPTGAAFHQVGIASNIVDDLGRAFAQAKVESRPVVLDVPVDFMDIEVDNSPTTYSASSSQRLAPDPDILDVALGIVANARRPLVLAGLGAVKSDAHAEIVRFADLIGAPVSTTVGSRGFFSGHPLDIGICGSLSHPVALDVIQQADCIISFGASLNEHTTERGSVTKGKALVQIDSDASHLNKYQKADVAMVADAKIAATQMLDTLEELGVEASTYGNRFRASIAEYSPIAEFSNQYDPSVFDNFSALLSLDKKLPASRACVTDAGRFIKLAWKTFSVPDAKKSFLTHNFGSIGLGIGTANGVALGSPDDITVLIAGDGGGIMNLMEFTVAVQNRLPIVMIVLNNGSYGAEYTKLAKFGLDPRHSLVTWPEFADMAIAMGGHGLTVRSVEDIDAIPASTWDPENLPLIIDVKLDPAADYEV